MINIRCFRYWLSQKCRISPVPFCSHFALHPIPSCLALASFILSSLCRSAILSSKRCSKFWPFAASAYRRNTTTCCLSLTRRSTSGSVVLSKFVLCHVIGLRVFQPSRGLFSLLETGPLRSHSLPPKARTHCERTCVHDSSLSSFWQLDS